MALLVLKFSGVALGTIDRIKYAAGKVAKEIRLGHKVVVVVSAMAGVTDQLFDHCRSVNPRPNPRESDVVVSTGEQVAAGLMALALEQRGLNAKSWLGWQLPIRTDASHGNARIQDVNAEPIRSCLERGEIAVLAGFQGLAEDRSVTTLGRGGSDASAVALAAALKANRCDLYADLPGLYSADTAIVPKARKISRLSYREMLEITALGAEDSKVLQPRSIEMGLLNAVPVQILSIFENEVGSDLPGTLITSEDEIMENRPVTGIAHSKGYAKITLAGLPDKPGVAANIFGAVARAGVNVGAIVQAASGDGQKTDVTFTVRREDWQRITELLEATKDKLGFTNLVTDANIAKVSLVGLGMRSHPGVAALMFETLYEKGINIRAIETSEITTSVLISEDYLELAVRALHDAFGLERAA